jgi:nucleoside-diphosphate-sugar epimerase
MIQPNRRRILVVGGTGFLGYRVVVALLEAGADVSALVQPERDGLLQAISNRIRIIHADVWNKGSLKGRARGHQTVVHLIGSARANPARGQTHQQINLISARNVTAMAVSDGVPRMILLSAAMRPWELASEYILSKRDAEDYLQKSGLEWTIVRAPALYPPGRLGLGVLSALGTIFPLSLFLGHIMPLSVDIAARGIAQLANNPTVFKNHIIHAQQLRHLARASQRRTPLPSPVQQQDPDPEGLNEPPVGWLPPGY